VEQCEAVFIAVGTPQGDTAPLISLTSKPWSPRLPLINGYKVIVEKSTVPVYTNEWIRRVLHRNGVVQGSFDVARTPSFCAKARR